MSNWTKIIKAEDNFKPFYIIEYGESYLLNNDGKPARTENEIAKYDTDENAWNKIENEYNSNFDNYDLYHITDKQFYNKILKQYGIKE